MLLCDMPKNKEIHDTFNKVLPLVAANPALFKRKSDSSFKLCNIVIRCFKSKISILYDKKEKKTLFINPINNLKIILLNNILMVDDVVGIKYV